MADVRVLALGGCNLRNPLKRRLDPGKPGDPPEWSTTAAGYQFAGPPFFTYVGVVLFDWSYMPDGRALGWPAGFSAAVVEAAAALRLPILDPADLVRRAGVAKALEENFRHYTDAFLPAITKTLKEFMFSVANGTRRAALSLPRQPD